MDLLQNTFTFDTDNEMHGNAQTMMEQIINLNTQASYFVHARQITYILCLQTYIIFSFACEYGMPLKFQFQAFGRCF